MNYPSNFAGRNGKMCYVEFGDEEAMKAGLAKNGQVSLSIHMGISVVLTVGADTQRRCS